MPENHFYNQEFLKSLIDLIHANISKEGFGAGELAKVAGMSQRKMGRRLHSLTKKSVSQFICEIRLEKAKELLQKEDLTAAEVSFKVGFGSPTYFNKCFSSYFGYPPGKVRKGEIPVHEETGSIHITPAPSPEKRFSKLLIYSAGILMSLAVLFLVFSHIIPKSRSENFYSLIPVIHNNTIAVLPFMNLGDNNSDQYFVDGLMDEIIGDLGNVSDLRVVSRMSVEDFRESKTPPGEIAKKLRVRYLVTGSAQKYEQSYMLRIQLTDAINNRIIWAESFQNEISTASDIFGTQSHVAQMIASKLKLTIKPEEKRRIDMNATESLSAYLFYLRGVDEMNKSRYPDFQPEHLKKAYYLFDKSLELDSTFALPYIGQAYVYWQRFARDMNVANYAIRARYVDSTMILANIALSYDPHLASAYNTRSAIYETHGNIAKALEENERALKCNPNDWFVNYWKAFLLEGISLTRAIEGFERTAVLGTGIELEQTLFELANVYFRCGFPDLGAFYYNEALQIGGDSTKYLSNLTGWLAAQGDFKKAADYNHRYHLKEYADGNKLGYPGMCYLFMGKEKEALNYFLKYLSESDSSRIKFYDLYPYMGYSFWQNGQKQLATNYFKKAIEINQQRQAASFPADYYSLAAIYAFLGDRDKAYDYLKLFSGKSFFNICDLTMIKNDPLFRNIRNEQKFQEFVRSAEASYMAEHERVGKWLESHKRF